MKIGCEQRLKIMKKNPLTSIQVLLAVVFLASSVASFAQPDGAAADKIDAWKKEREEFLNAEKLMGRKNVGAQSLQKQIDQLTERRASIERDRQYSRSKLNNANTQFTTATRLAAQDDIEKWRKEVAAWEGRLKSNEAELTKNEADAEATFKQLQEKMGVNQSDILLPGQAVQIIVVEDESFNGLYQIRRGGYVVLPRVGRVQVAGKDMVGAEKILKEVLEVNQLRQATVMIERTGGGYETESGDVIYLAGEFSTPGPMRIPEGYSPTLVTTILRAGGMTRVADLTHVKLLRLQNGKALVEEVNVQAILEGSGLPSDLALNSGDIIVVPAYSPIIYVTGNVARPGVLQLSPDEALTAYAAILRSGGFARFAKTKGVYVIRDHGNGEKSKIPVNIKDVQAGRVPDVVLMGLDIIVVPESWFSW